MWGVAVTLLAVALVLLYYYLASTLNYWKERGVPCVKSVPLFGSLKNILLLQQHPADFFLEMYRKFEGSPYVGMYQVHRPTLMVRDPDLIKEILVKDFSNFMNHGFEADPERDVLQARNLFNLEGREWKEMRIKLSPTFTSGRMKEMFPLVQECADVLHKHLTAQAQAGADVNIKDSSDYPIKSIVTGKKGQWLKTGGGLNTGDLIVRGKAIMQRYNDIYVARKVATIKNANKQDILARFTTDVISSCVFGVKCNSVDNPNEVFRQMGLILLGGQSYWVAFKNAIIAFAPRVAKLFRFTFATAKVDKYFRSVVRNVMNLRATTGQFRKDFMQLMIELKEKGFIALKEEDKLDEHEMANLEPGFVAEAKTIPVTDDDIMAQALVFFFAGFETSSSVLSFAMYELGRKPELLAKARRQIEKVLTRHDGKFTYQAMQDMTFLDWILQETLRLYPPVPMISRKCSRSYVMPGTDLVVEKDMLLFIPIYGLQKDPKFFDNPDEFDPERFQDSDLLQRNQFMYMPFGEGPRQCIGMRFARMQSKICLATVLRDFNLSISPRTKLPFTWDIKQFLLSTKHPIYITLSRNGSSPGDESVD